MPAATSIHDFLDVARKSNQIDNERLETYLSKNDTFLPDDPRKLAARLIREGLMSVFQAEQFLLGKYKGFSLGNYRFLERLGSGGTGTVYLAEHQVMKRRVAIKVLPTIMAEDPAILERFRREAQAAAVLSHRNVIHVYDLGQEGNLHYLVMEYIDGRNLQQVIRKRGALPVGVACDYARQAALGLQHAHEAGLVHRDVKPANLLVDASGTVKVLDLGLVLIEGREGRSVTQNFNSGQVLGTADYLAPEQALCLHQVDHRADIYSLGATLYALLTGRAPFHTGTLGQKLLWHQTRMPDPVDAVQPDVPSELSDVVMRMLAKRPEERQSSALEVADLLATWADPLAGRQVDLGRGSRTELYLGPGTGTLLGGTTRRTVVPMPAPLLAPSRKDTTQITAQEEASCAEVHAPSPVSPAGQASNLRILLLGGLAGALVALAVVGTVLLIWGTTN